MDIIFGDGTYYTCRTPYTHTIVGYYQGITACQDCGEVLGYGDYPSVTYCGLTEPHHFRWGVCEGCNYVRSTCPHSNASGTEVYLNAKYTSLNENEHSVTGYKTKAYTCPECGDSWKDYPGYNKTTASESHNFVNDVCKDCGYRKAAEGQAEPPKSVAIVQQNQKLNLGETLQLTAKFSPEGASSELSWTSSDAKIATVDANGLVTPVKEGSVTITVKTANGKSGTTKITVVDPYKLTGVKLDKTGTVNLNLGETLTLIPSPVPETAQATYTWKTSSTKVAKVENGVVTPVAEGTATITVTAMRGSITKTATVKVKVVDPYKLTGVKLDKTGTVNLNLGETLTLIPSPVPETALSTYTWKTSSTKIAKVEGGVVTPVAEGTATITVTATRGSIKKTATVKVKVVDPYKPTSVKLDKTGTVSLNLGESLTLTPSLSPETAQATYSWKTSSTKIATVVDGVVTPVGEGTATITVTATRGSVKKTATVKVKVVDPYKPTSVKLDKMGTVNLNLGETLTLTPSLSPETAQATYSWKTSSTKIATVADGVVTPIGEGTATITVTATRGNIKKTATVKVKVVDPYKPTSVKLDKTGTVNLNLGESLTLTPSLSPETAQATYTWKTSSTKIATVVDGVVTPVGEGTATITVTATRGSITKTATVKVKVVDPYKPTAVKLDKTGTVNLNLGETLTLTPSLSPETAQSTYSWKTSSTKIATVADGVVTPVGEGTATITVTATRGNIKKTATVKVKVVDPYKPTSVKLDKTGTVSLNLGESLTLTPSISPETAQATYSWKTSSTKIATVADGVVTPVGEGTATITVTATRGKIKKTATVKVKVVDPYKPTAVKLDKTGTVNLNLGESLTLTPSLSPETAQATYTWKTSSTKIATVADGVVTPVGEGTATITVTATRGKIKKTATVKVKVVDPYKPTSLKLKETGTVWLELGDSTQLTPILGPETAKATYSWKSSSTKIATVDENGVVRPVARGTATITVTATRGSVKKTASVKVKVVEPYVVDALVLSHRDAPKDLKVKVGELCDVTVTVKPASAQATANLSFTASNGNVSVTKQASNKFRVTGVKAGTTTITVKDVNTGVKTTMKVVVTK